MLLLANIGPEAKAAIPMLKGCLLAKEMPKELRMDAMVAHCCVSHLWTNR